MSKQHDRQLSYLDEGSALPLGPRNERDHSEAISVQLMLIGVPPMRYTILHASSTTDVRYMLRIAKSDSVEYAPIIGGDLDRANALAAIYERHGQVSVVEIVAVENASS